MSWGYRHWDLDDADEFGNDYDFDDDSSTSSSDKEYGEYASNQYRNRGHGRSVLTELASQRKNGELLDLVVEVDGREFPCHRALLASTPYFKAMLFSNLAESKSKVVQLHGIDSIKFSKILDFLYTGEIRISKDDVQDILQSAHMLQLDKIVLYCQQFIRNRVCSSNCLGVMRLADMYGFSGLKQKAKKKALTRFSKVGQNEELLSLSLEELLDLLKDKDLKVDEDEVVYSVIRWLDHDPESRKTTVPTILKEIRLSCVRVSALRKLEAHSVIREFPEFLAKITAAKEQHLTGTRQPGSGAQGPDATGGAQYGMSDGLAIIVGGWKEVERQDDDESRTEPPPLRSIICLDPDIQQHYHVTNLPTPVSGYMSATCAEGRIYVTGGRAHPFGWGHQSAASRQAFCYDFPSDSWMPLPDMPRGRAEHHSVVVDGNLFLIGGEATSVLTMDCYNLEEGAWVKPPTPPKIGVLSALKVAAFGGKFVLIEVMKRQADEYPVHFPNRPMTAGDIMNYQRNMPQSQRRLSVHTFDVKKDLWVKSQVLVRPTFEDVLATTVHDKLYLCAWQEKRSSIYVFDAQEATLTKVENRDVFTGNFFRTRLKYDDRDPDDFEQEDIVDATISYKFERNGCEEKREEKPQQTSLPFSLFGHSFLGTTKSSVGWYCRDLEKLGRARETFR